MQHCLVRKSNPGRSRAPPLARSGAIVRAQNVDATPASSAPRTGDLCIEFDERMRADRARLAAHHLVTCCARVRVLKGGARFDSSRHQPSSF